MLPYQLDPALGQIILPRRPVLAGVHQRAHNHLLHAGDHERSPRRHQGQVTHNLFFDGGTLPLETNRQLGLVARAVFHTLRGLRIRLPKGVTDELDLRLQREGFLKQSLQPRVPAPARCHSELRKGFERTAAQLRKVGQFDAGWHLAHVPGCGDRRWNLGGRL